MAMVRRSEVYILQVERRQNNILRNNNNNNNNNNTIPGPPASSSGIRTALWCRVQPLLTLAHMQQLTFTLPSAYRTVHSPTRAATATAMNRKQLIPSVGTGMSNEIFNTHFVPTDIAQRLGRAAGEQRNSSN